MTGQKKKKLIALAHRNKSLQYRSAEDGAFSDGMLVGYSLLTCLGTAEAI